MLSRTKITDYSIGQKLLHWIIATAILLDLFVAQKFGRFMPETDRFESRNDHASLGTLVAVLLAIRIYLRFKIGKPAPPNAIPIWQQNLAHLAHWGLYLLLATLVLSGIGSAFTANSTISPFGLFSYGNGYGKPALYDAIRAIHKFATESIILLIAIHVLAACYHLRLPKHRQSSLRMMKFWRSENSKR